MKNVGHFLCVAASALGILAFVACDKQQDGVPPVSDFVLYASIEQPVSAAAPCSGRLLTAVSPSVPSFRKERCPIR